MKKVIKGILIIFVFIILVLVSATFFLNTMVKTGIERLGPKITGTDVSVSEIDLSPFSGTGRIKGLVIGNPEGFRTQSAFRIEDIYVSLNPDSVFSDVIVIREVRITEPEVTFEGTMGRSNIGTIQENIESFRRSRSTDPEKGPKGAEHKVQIDRFIMEQPKVKLSAIILKGKAGTIPMSDIRLNGIGEKAGGITLGEAFFQIFKAVQSGIVKAVSDAGHRFQKGAERMEGAVQDLDAAKEKGKKAVESLQDLLGQ